MVLLVRLNIMLVGMMIVWIVDTNAEHEYLFIMERSDIDVGEGASATEPNRRTEGESVDRRQLSVSEGGGD